MWNSGKQRILLKRKKLKFKTSITEEIEQESFENDLNRQGYNRT